MKLKLWAVVSLPAANIPKKFKCLRDYCFREKKLNTIHFPLNFVRCQATMCTIVVKGEVIVD